MTVPHYLVRIVLHRRFWVLLLTVFLVIAFSENLPKKPRYEFRTEPVSEEPKDRARLFRILVGGSDVYVVSNDGLEVVTKTGHGVIGGKYYDPKLKIWDVTNGTLINRSHWNDPEWQELLIYRWDKDEAFLQELALTSSGKAIFDDPAAWWSLKERLTLADHDASERQRPLYRHENEITAFPCRFGFSPDGRTISYHARCGQPVFGEDESAEGTIVEDTRTGEQIALLFDVFGKVVVGPNAESVISENYYDQDPRSEQAFLTLWRLKSSPRSTELFLPSGARRVEFSSDGRLVFAQSCSPGLVRWWDVSTGRQLGEVLTRAEWTSVDRGRLLVIRNDGALNYWDTRSGKELSDWDFRERPIGTHTHGSLLERAHDKYLLVNLDPDSRPQPTRLPKFLQETAEKVGEKLIGKPESMSRILVLDVSSRRELGDVPGWSGAVSENGEWLATIDEEGIVRVWRMPLAKPWARSIGYALAIGLGLCFLFPCIRWIRRRSVSRA